METHTRRKLAEAVFFFDQLKQAIEVFHPTLEFYLSAFCAAARSTTFLMQAEYARVPGFNEWWSAYRGKLQPYFQTFNDLRVVIVHVQYPATRHHFVTDFGEEGLRVGAGESVEIPLKITRRTVEHIDAVITDATGHTRKQTVVQTRDLRVTVYYEKEKRDIEFISFSKDAAAFLADLKAIVDECESKFGLPEPL